MKENLPEFFIAMLKKQYGEELAKEIIEGYLNKREVTFRVNTLKTTVEEVESKLQGNKIEFEKVTWSKQTGG